MLTVDGEEEAAFPGHLRRHHGSIFTHRLERKGSKIWWERERLMIVWDTDSAGEGEAEIIIDKNVIVIEFRKAQSELTVNYLPRRLLKGRAGLDGTYKQYSSLTYGQRTIQGGREASVTVCEKRDTRSCKCHV